MRSRESTHEQCLELLPWFVNGSLQPEQRAIVERHVSDCAECGAELLAQQQLQTKLREGDSVMLAPQASWQKMAERLDIEAEAISGVPRKRIASRTPNRGWHFAMVAQAAVITGLAIALWWQMKPAAVQTADTNSPTAIPRYETLTSDVDVPIASRASGAEYRVVFQRDVPIAGVNELLQSLSAQIVSGPTEAGVYLLSLPPERASEATNLLTRLRDDRRVIFAEHLNLIEYQP